MTVRGEHGQKLREADGSVIRKQVRHPPALALFDNDYPGIKVGKIKFAQLRPVHVLLSSKLPHNVCLCREHEDVIGAIDALHKACPEFPSYSHDIPETFLCQPPASQCWVNEREQCRDAAGFVKAY